MPTPYIPREFQVAALLSEDSTQYTLLVFLEIYEKQNTLYAVLTDGTVMSEVECSSSRLLPVYSEGRVYLGTLVQTVKDLTATGLATLSNTALMEMVRTALEIAVVQGATPVLK